MSAVNVMRKHFSPSAETNCPTAEETPPLPSTNWTSETIMLSSRTEPQPVHTALPRAWSTSMSEPPQVLHTRELMVEVRGHLVESEVLSIRHQRQEPPRKNRHTPSQLPLLLELVNPKCSVSHWRWTAAKTRRLEAATLRKSKPRSARNSSTVTL